MIIVNEQERLFKEYTGIDFNSFYKNNKPKLVWYLSKWTNDLITAEDFADDAFIQALNKINTFDKLKSHISTWIYTIGLNLVKKDFKDKEKMPTVSMDNAKDDAPLNLFLPSSDNMDNKEKICENNEKANIIVETILSLPDRYEKYKTVLIMRELEHMQYQDIAAELNLNLSTVKSQIKKGREIICKKIEKKIEFIDRFGLSHYNINEIPPIRLSGSAIDKVVSKIKTEIQIKNIDNDEYQIKLIQLNLEGELKSELNKIVNHYHYESEFKNEISLIINHLQIENDNCKEILTIINYYNYESVVKKDIAIIIHHIETEKMISNEIYLINKHFQIEQHNRLLIADNVTQTINETFLYYFIESLLNKEINKLSNLKIKL